MGYRYIGAKSRIVDEVLACVDRIVPPGSVVADLMCGTASVSAALHRAGYDVIANDVMTYSYHHARVSLCIFSPPEFAGAASFMKTYYPKNGDDLFSPSSNYERMLAALNNVEPREGYFFKEFSPAGNPKNSDTPRKYFTPENAMKIDGIRTAISTLAQSNAITDLEHSLLVHDLIMAANDVANIAGTYGHYLSRFVARATEAIRMYQSTFVQPRKNCSHQIFRARAEDLAGQIVSDLCYIDPPYIKRQYAANYHLLETLARGDEPEAIGVSGLRPWRDQYSDFCTKTKIRDSFRKVIAGMKCRNFLVSYSEDGLLTVPQLRELFEEFGQVQVHEFENKRFKSNSNEAKATIKEYLIHLHKRRDAICSPSTS